MNQILFNPKDTVVEFMCNHQVYIFQPGEKKLLDKAVAFHALHYANAGLLPYDGTLEVSGAIDYGKMPWRQVVSMASKRGLFKPGMSREEINKILEEDDKRAGTV